MCSGHVCCGVYCGQSNGALRGLACSVVYLGEGYRGSRSLCTQTVCIGVVSRLVCPKGDFVCPLGMGYVCTALMFNRLWLTCVPKGSKYLPFRNAFNPNRHSSLTHLIDKFGMMHIAIFHADYRHFSVLIVTCKPVHRGGELIYRVLNPPSQEEGVAVARS